MKINKISQSLVLLPLTGVISLIGAPTALATECSVLSPCVVNSVPAVTTLTDTLASADAQIPAPSADSVTAPITQAVDKVTDPVVGAVNQVTAPVVDAVDNVTAPIDPVIPVPVEPITIIPAPSTAVEQPSDPVVSVAAKGADADFVSPTDTKSASDTSIAEKLHDSSAASSGALDGTTTLAPNTLNFNPAAVHSSKGSTTKINYSGAFGFGHSTPVDDTVGVNGLMVASLIALGSAIGSAIKRGAFPSFRTIINRI